MDQWTNDRSALTASAMDPTVDPAAIKSQSAPGLAEVFAEAFISNGDRQCLGWRRDPGSGADADAIPTYKEGEGPMPPFEWATYREVFDESQSLARVLADTVGTGAAEHGARLPPGLPDGR